MYPYTSYEIGPLVAPCNTRFSLQKQGKKNSLGYEIEDGKIGSSGVDIEFNKKWKASVIRISKISRLNLCIL